MADAARPDVLCIGAVLWDVIGRTPGHMKAGDDVPGRIAHIPGGVALNAAAELARRGMRPAVLGAVGDEPDGSALVRLGSTTVVCGVKAEIAEPELDKPKEGFLGASHVCFLRCMRLRVTASRQFRTSTSPQSVLPSSSRDPQQTKRRCSRTG